MTLERREEPLSSHAPRQGEPYPWRVGLGLLLATLLGVGALALLMGGGTLPWGTTPDEVGSLVTVAPTAEPRPTRAASTATPLAGAGAATSASPSATPRSTPVPTATAVVATATPVQRAPTTTAAGPAAGSCPPLPAPIDATVYQEVLQAYERYWSRRAIAFRDLKPELIDEVATGTELNGSVERIKELRAEGRAVETQVRHHICVLWATADEAAIADEYESRSVFIDATTKEPLEPRKSSSDPAPLIKVQKLLQKVDGVWKVAGGELYE